MAQLWKLWWWLGVKLHRFEEHPHFNRWLAGLRQLFWTRACGHDWRYAWHTANIYWRPRRRPTTPASLEDQPR